MVEVEAVSSDEEDVPSTVKPTTTTTASATATAAAAAAAAAAATPSQDPVATATGDLKGVVDADGRINVTDDGRVKKKVLVEGSGVVVPVLSRVYVQVGGMLPDGTVFLDSLTEEINFTLGHAEVPKGLEMTVCGMKVGERAIITMCGQDDSGGGAVDYGYSKTRRPACVPATSDLIMDVTVMRFEQEKNLHQMTVDEKFEFCEQRRGVGKELFGAGKPASAEKQYEKAIHVLEQGLKDVQLDDEIRRRNALHAMMYVNIAACRLKRADYAGAVSQCNKALACDATLHKARYRRAQARLRLGDWEESKRDFVAVRAASIAEAEAAEAAATAAAASDADDAAATAATHTATAVAARKLCGVIDGRIAYCEQEAAKVLQKQRRLFSNKLFNSGDAQSALYDDKPTPPAEQPWSGLSWGDDDGGDGSFLSTVRAWVSSAGMACVRFTLWATERCFRRKGRGGGLPGMLTPDMMKMMQHPNVGDDDDDGEDKKTK